MFVIRVRDACCRQSLAMHAPLSNDLGLRLRGRVHKKDIVITQHITKLGYTTSETHNSTKNRQWNGCAKWC